MNGIEEEFNNMSISDKINKYENKFKLSDFNIENELGRGAYAKVYKAVHKETGVIYALKSIDIKLITREKKLHHIFVEVDILNMLNHPNIAKIHGVIINENSKIILIMDYYCNGDLFDFLKDNSKYYI